jgi:kynurenine formamidase
VHAVIEHRGQRWSVELDRPLNITLPLRRNSSNRRAYFLPPSQIAPVRTQGFIGSIAEGGTVNCDQIVLSPHGNGTHTECLRHVADVPLWIADAPRSFLVLGQLLTVQPTAEATITAVQLAAIGQVEGVSAAILRTLPNDPGKAERDWSGANPPYLTEEATQLLVERGIEHLLVDLPSIDPESDGGALRAHRAFWDVSGKVRLHATITELCYIPDAIADGFYLVQLGILPLESDASPSHVVLYPAQRL